MHVFLDIQNKAYILFTISIAAVEPEFLAKRRVLWVCVWSYPVEEHVFPMHY